MRRNTHGVRHGFLYNGTSYITLDVPFTDASPTYPTGIDGSNIVGTYLMGNTWHGFVATPVPEPATLLLLGSGLLGLIGFRKKFKK